MTDVVTRPAGWRPLLRGRSVARLVARAAIGLLAPLLVLFLGAAPAQAHATLLGTDPAEGAVLEASPGEVTFSFDEPVSITGEAVRLFDAAGEELDASSVAEGETITADVPDELGEGTYVVVWRAVSDDGHPISGSLTFSVGTPSAEVVAPDVTGAPSGDVRVDLGLLQGIGYAGLLLAAGLAVFGRWVLAGVRVPDAARGRLVRVRLVGVGVALGSAALLVPVTGAYQQGLGIAGVLDPAAYDLTLVSDALVVLVLQALGLAVALSSRAGRTEAALGVLCAVFAPALVGHTRAFDPVPLLILTDTLHLAAGAVWVGGLVGLLLVLPALGRRPEEAAVVVRRVSTSAAAVLVAVAITGTLLATRTLGRWAGLVDTTYGRLLLVKVGLVGIVVLVAAWNRFRLVPRVSSAVGHGEGVRAAGLLRRTVAVEAVVVLAVIGVTGFLVNQPPRPAPERAPAAESRVRAAVADDVKVLVTLTPGGTGRNTVQVQVQDETGEPVDGYAAPQVSVTSADVDLGAVRLRATAAGTYAAEVVLPAPGTWTVQVSVRTDEFTNPVVPVEFEVR